MADPAKTQEQALAQCRVVAYLAKQIALVHEQKAEAYESWNMSPGLIDVVGQMSTNAMQTLGDMLNGMDAIDENEDGWTFRIFDVAQATWPTSK